MKRHLLYRETPDRPRVDVFVSDGRHLGWLFHGVPDSEGGSCYRFVPFISGLPPLTESTVERVKARLRFALTRMGGVR